MKHYLSAQAPIVYQAASPGRLVFGWLVATLCSTLLVIGLFYGADLLIEPSAEAPGSALLIGTLSAWLILVALLAVWLLRVARREEQRQASLNQFAYEHRLLRSMFLNIPSPVALVDQHNLIREANPAFEALVGRSTEEIFGQPLPRFLVEASRTRFEALSEALWQEGTPHGELRLQVQRRDGKVRWVRANSAIIPRSEEECIRIISMHDETDSEAIRHRLETAESIAKVGHWAFHLRSEESVWSDEVFRIMGLSPGDGVPAFDAQLALYHPRDQSRIQAALLEVSESGGEFDLTASVICPDGVERRVVITARSVPDRNGEVSEVIGTVQDITEREEADRELEVIHSQLKLATESAGVGIFEYDLESRRIVGDEHFAALYGLEGGGGELSRDLCDDCVIPEDRLTKATQLAELRERGQRLDLSYRILHPVRGIRYLQSRAVVQEGRDGRLKLVGALWDSTEQLRYQRNLELLTERFRLASETSGIGIWEWEPGSSSVTWDENSFRICGLLRSDQPIAKETWMGLVVAEHRGLLEAFLEQVVETQGTHELEYRICRADGKERFMRTRARLITHGQEPSRVLGTDWDVTAERETAATMEAALARAEEGARAKSTFLAAMSHEIRTPMNGVIGMAHILSETTLDDEQREFLQIIISSGETLLALINDILDFSKVDAGKMRLDCEPFDLPCTVLTTYELLQPQARAKRLEMSVHVDERIPAVVQGDEHRVRQILLNLLGNGIKFTREGEVKLQMMLGSENEESLMVRFSVQDTGIGIPEDKHHLLFQHFSQIDNANTREFGGTGLGLAICKRIVDQMGGVIGCESALGVGSTFWFEIPFRKGSPEASPDPFLETDSGSPFPVLPAPLPLETRKGLWGRVLIAEDSLVNQKVSGLMMERLGYEVTFAAHGQEVLALLAKEPFRIILMDLQMPELDGLEATRRIRAGEAPGVRPYIIALTAGVLDLDQQRARDAGMDDFLSKPVSMEALAQAIERAEDYHSRQSMLDRAATLEITLRNS